LDRFLLAEVLGRGVIPHHSLVLDAAYASPFAAPDAQPRQAWLATTDVPAAQPACECCQTQASLALSCFLEENFVWPYSASTRVFVGTGAMLAPR